MKRLHLSVLAAILLAAVLLTGCSERTNISAIRANCEQYMNKKVSIAGTIKQVEMTLPAAPGRMAYLVDDGTAEIWVVTKTGLPEEGQKVGVSGVVYYGETIQGHTFVAVVREIERVTR